MNVTDHSDSSDTSGLILTTSRSDEIRRDHQRLHRGVYVSPTRQLSAIEQVQAAVLRAGSGAVAAGHSAMLLHGVTFPDLGADIELIRDITGQGRYRDSVRVVRTSGLAPDDVDTVNGIPVTSPIRTAYDIGRRRPEWLALGYLDDLIRATGFDLAQLWRYTVNHPRSRGIRQLRGLVPMIDVNAESHGESWVRWRIATAGLPVPEAQVVVRDWTGEAVARFDLGYRRWKVGIEYDGVDHHTSETQRASDAERDRRTRELGWQTIRVNGQRMSDDSMGVIAEIEEELAIRGFRRAR